MLVQVNYLKNHKSVNAGPLMSCLCEEVQRAAVDPAHLQVHLDWVQYKKSFRRRWMRGATCCRTAA